MVIGRAEGDELPWNYPIDVSVFNLLVVLILCDVKLFVVEPSEPDSIMKASQAVQNLVYRVVLCICNCIDRNQRHGTDEIQRFRRVGKLAQVSFPGLRPGCKDEYLCQWLSTR